MIMLLVVKVLFLSTLSMQSLSFELFDSTNPCKHSTVGTNSMNIPCERDYYRMRILQLLQNVIKSTSNGIVLKNFRDVVSNQHSDYGLGKEYWKEPLMQGRHSIHLRFGKRFQFS
ncbi:hypothetical protein T01_2633 [Trichinella spiralis]|uniref:Uncharacterized protein n=1 Tax=Trichinella spiralis TaxID=6334 RepID=A0A0V1BAP0_TRISP|nr:hypothetical protein T01_2633 [Trichinella spiralis]